MRELSDEDLFLPLLHAKGTVQQQLRAGDYPTNPNMEADQYTDEESRFIRAVARFRAINRINSPSLCQLFWIVRQMGYTCGHLR